MKLLLITIGVLIGGLMATQSDKYAALRERMVKRQIIDRGISDKETIRALTKVPRHLFVPEDLQNEAYNDSPLPIGYGQTISQPYIVALMTEVAEPAPGKRVLEIGTGSGYQAAVLAEIADTVYTIEIVPELAKTATERFRQLGYNNIITRFGDGYRGWPEHAPFDVMIVTAAPDNIPQPLIDQLAENGRMVIPVGDANGVQELLLVTKKKGKVFRERLTSVRFVPFQRQ